MFLKRKLLFLAAVLTILFAGTAWAGDIALTTIGQSPDFMMVKVVLKKMMITPDTDNLLTAEKLEGHKILIAVVGGSSKGLGAAGIDKEHEIHRGEELFRKARDRKMNILVMHVGGEGRRGKLSDAFINTAVPYADKLILVEGANEDGLFDTLVKGKDTEIKTVPNVRATSGPLKEVLSGWGVAVE